jgi:ketosteroid isomerase-like protein
MSRENVELVRSLEPNEVDLVERVKAAEKGETFLGVEVSDLFAEEFEVEWIAAGSGEGIHHRGAAGMLEGWRDWLTPYESYVARSEDLLDAGDQVVAFTRIQAKTRRDRVVIEHSPAAVWTIEGGKVVRIRFFLEREAAPAAAGVSHREETGLRLTDSEE